MARTAYRPASAAARIGSTAPGGTTPSSASTSASAASTSSIAWRRARSDSGSATSASPNSGPSRPDPSSLDIEEDGLAGALHHQIEQIPAVAGLPRDERVTTIAGNAREDRILRVGDFVLEVEALDQPREDAARHDDPDDSRVLGSAIRALA